MAERNLSAAFANHLQEKFNIKVSPIVIPTIIFCLVISLFMPYKIIQFICLATFAVLILSLLYAMVLKSNIKIERNTSTLKLACKEKSEIQFTIKNYSPLTAHVCYFFDSVPYFYIFNDG